MTDMSEPYSNLPERVASIEAVIPHLATKADLLALEVRIGDRLDSMRNWIIGMLVTNFIGFGTLAVALFEAVKR